MKRGTQESQVEKMLRRSVCWVSFLFPMVLRLRLTHSLHFVSNFKVFQTGTQSAENQVIMGWQIELKIRYFDIWDRKVGAAPSAPYVNTCRKMQYRAAAPLGILGYRGCNFLSEKLNPNKIRILHVYALLWAATCQIKSTQHSPEQTRHHLKLFHIISTFSLLDMNEIRPQTKSAIAPSNY